MDIKGFLTLFGGLALFLYGMKMMSDGLEAAAGDRLQLILEKLKMCIRDSTYIGRSLWQVL